MNPTKEMVRAFILAYEHVAKVTKTQDKFKVPSSEEMLEIILRNDYNFLKLFKWDQGSRGLSCIGPQILSYQLFFHAVQTYRYDKNVSELYGDFNLFHEEIEIRLGAAKIDPVPGLRDIAPIPDPVQSTFKTLSKKEKKKLKRINPESVYIQSRSDDF